MNANQILQRTGGILRTSARVADRMTRRTPAPFGARGTEDQAEASGSDHS